MFAADDVKQDNIKSNQGNVSAQDDSKCSISSYIDDFPLGDYSYIDNFCHISVHNCPYTELLCT